MMRPEPPDHVPTPDGPLSATADAVAGSLLACGFAERILLLTAGETVSPLDRELEGRIAARKGSLRILPLPADPAAAGRQLAAILAQDLPEGIVNRSSRAIGAWPAVRDALAGGSRLLELPGLDDDALVRCLADVDLGGLRWNALELVRRIDRGSTLTVRGGGRERSFAIGGSRASDFLAPPLMRGTTASLPGAVAISGLPGRSTLLIGLHPTARPGSDPLEASRSLGTVTVLGPDGRPEGDPLTSATVLVDGVAIVRDGTPAGSDSAAAGPSARKRRGRIGRTLDAARRLISGMPFRRFHADGGGITIAGPLTAQAAWLRGLTGHPVGRLEGSGAFLAGGLRRRLRPDDVVISALGGPRSRLERIGDRAAGWLEVPTYARMIVPLAPLRESGLEAFAAVCHSTKDTLRYIRTKRLGWKTLAADRDAIRRFEERYHVPTMVDRHGPEAAIRPPASLLEECGRAELLAIMHEDRAVGMALFRSTSPRAELLQIGVLDGDEAWLRLRILALCYALPALHCAGRGIEEYDFGRTPPFPWHPVLNFKSKWGTAVDPGPASDRLRVRLPAAAPATWKLLTRSGLIALRRDGRPIAIVAVDATSDLGRLRDVAVPGLDEILVVIDGVAGEAVTAAFADVRNPRPVRLAPRGELDRLASIVG